MNILNKIFKNKFKIYYRKKVLGFSLFFMISRTQKVTGIVSNVFPSSDLHHPMWDFDNVDLIEVKAELKRIQEKFNLDTIIVYSDKEKYYRALAPFDAVSISDLLKIILNTLYVDSGFFKWTVIRNCATIRLTKKAGRRESKIVAVIEGKTMDSKMLQIDNFVFVDYECDLEKVNEVIEKNG